jgi:hypothetical protein
VDKFTLQVLKSDPDARVLVAAPSNSATDVVALRLLQLGAAILNPRLMTDKVLRGIHGLLYISYESPRGHTLYSPSVVVQTWAFLLLHCTISALNYGHRL